MFSGPAQIERSQLCSKTRSEKLFGFSPSYSHYSIVGNTQSSTSLRGKLAQGWIQLNLISPSRRMAELSLEELNLSVRSRNCLMRVEIRTFGDLNEQSSREGDVSRIRNLGVKSREEIIRIFRAECYALLNGAEKLDYWQRVLECDII